MILVEDVIGLCTRSNRASPFQHLQARRPKTPKSDITSILVPGLGKAENVQSVITPELTDHVHLVGDGVDVEGGTHELTSRMTGMALKVWTYQAVCGTTINPTGMREEVAEDGGTEAGSASNTKRSVACNHWNGTKRR